MQQSQQVKIPLASFINDVMVLGGEGGQGFYDDSTKALVIKPVTMGKGGKNCPRLRDVIFGRPLRIFFVFMS